MAVQPGMHRGFDDRTDETQGGIQHHYPSMARPADHGSLPHVCHKPELPVPSTACVCVCVCLCVCECLCVCVCVCVCCIMCCTCTRRVRAAETFDYRHLHLSWPRLSHSAKTATGNSASAAHLSMSPLEMLLQHIPRQCDIPPLDEGLEHLGKVLECHQGVWHKLSLGSKWSPKVATMRLRNNKRPPVRYGLRTVYVLAPNPMCSVEVSIIQLA